MNDIMEITCDAEKYVATYNSMCAAIAKCFKVDECKDISDRTVAIAAYFKQINGLM